MIDDAGRSGSHVLVLVAHPDDAEIGVGGAIAAWTHAGTRVTVGCVAVSEQSAEMAARRRMAATEAAKVLGHELVWLVPGDLRQVEELPEYQLVSLVDRVVRELDADVVVTHNELDSHADHRRVAAAVLASSRTWPDVAYLQLAVNEHRTPAFGSFIPSVLVPVEPHLDRQGRALDAFSYEGQGFRSLDRAGIALRSRALGSQCNVGAAEGLQLVRVVAGTRGGAGLAELLMIQEKP